MEIKVEIKEKAFMKDQKSVQVLDDIHLTFNSGDFITVIGPSGCGKSTLLKIIAGLDVDYEGSVVIGSNEVKKPSIDKGFIFQEHRLFPWLTVEQNIAANLPLKKPELREQVNQLINIVRLNGFEKAYPKELSGGMSQRVAIARALLREPKVLLLDEPFGALDAFTRQHLQDVLIDIWLETKTTMILVTHDVDESVYLGTKVVVMKSKPGKVGHVIPIELPFPRQRTDQTFQEVRNHVLKHFEQLDQYSAVEG
ncbi:ATP-binding cassette domain-containing protein [Terrilactibacillus sp. BCM23-1]|uniref:ATP-binding cassette domain-containing protein n=1 Tax=Terrilactibacillus tamarindi TaxID=2599694 RepID=A0A6N8CQD8_9BACI|nr:ABC transporter ATP-binding protein [Terrilactibacillus tamarindi]MTT32354.1 ATP-binding cassette domain-containing protein [Terrilactibacillus tamarindi]